MKGEVAPQYGGMLDMGSNHGDGLYRCAGCGWEGIPTSIRGVLQTECPVCEKESDEDMLALGEPVKLVPKQGRNEPCACGSGKKFKKCCGA